MLITLPLPVYLYLFTLPITSNHTSTKIYTNIYHTHNPYHNPLPPHNPRKQVHEDSGRSKGWGLVEFVSPSGAAQAVEILQGTNLNGRPVSVKVDRA